jgi:hypothetical protein
VFADAGVIMKSILSRKWAMLVPAAMAAATAFAAPAFAAAGAQTNEPAVWKEQDLVLDYMGFTTHYSCDGLRDRVRAVLLQLGARPDLRITSSGCVRAGGGPERFPSVQVHFATLQPAPSAAPVQPATAPGAAAGTGAPATSAGASAPAVTAGAGAWKRVNLGGVNGFDGGECELAEAVVRTVLPHFTVRNLDWHEACVPHTASIALSLRMDVFAPAVPPPAN